MQSPKDALFPERPPANYLWVVLSFCLSRAKPPSSQMARLARQSNARVGTRTLDCPLVVSRTPWHEKERKTRRTRHTATPRHTRLSAYVPRPATSEVPRPIFLSLSLCGCEDQKQGCHLIQDGVVSVELSRNAEKVKATAKKTRGGEREKERTTRRE